MKSLNVLHTPMSIAQRDKRAKRHEFFLTWQPFLYEHQTLHP